MTNPLTPEQLDARLESGIWCHVARDAVQRLERSDRHEIEYRNKIKGRGWAAWKAGLEHEAWNQYRVRLK